MPLPHLRSSPRRRTAAPRRRTTPVRAPQLGKEASWPIKHSLPAFPVRSHARCRSEPPSPPANAYGPRGSFLTPQLGSPSRALPPSPDPSLSPGRECVIVFSRRSSAARRRRTRRRSSTAAAPHGPRVPGRWI
jgi:hypothetical protein